MHCIIVKMMNTTCSPYRVEASLIDALCSCPVHLPIKGIYVLQVINAAAVVFVWFMMVETKQRSLSQIQAQLVNS